MKKVEDEINGLVKSGVTEPVNEPTDWCALMVVVPKPNRNVGLCVDLTKLNEGVRRELYVMKKVEETLGSISSGTVISKLDANSSFHQVNYYTVWAVHVQEASVWYILSSWIFPEKDGQRTDRPPRSVVPHGWHPCDRPKQGGTWQASNLQCLQRNYAQPRQVSLLHEQTAIPWSGNWQRRNQERPSKSQGHHRVTWTERRPRRKTISRHGEPANEVPAEPCRNDQTDSRPA